MYAALSQAQRVALRGSTPTRAMKGYGMQAVNELTIFFLAAFRKMAEDKGKLIDQINEMRLEAGDTLDDSTKAAMQAGIKMAVLTLVTQSVADILNSINAAGRVLCRIGVPDADHGSAMTAEQLQAAAEDAAKKLAAIINVTKKISMCALNNVDFEHIAEVLVADGMPAIELAEKERLAKANGAPVATPFSGTATPLHRCAPSQN